jgi:histidyl-tRNA synthetase
MSNIKAIRGMNDILPSITPIWQYVETKISNIVKSYGYSEIRFPIVEQTSLYKRSVGDTTDIVSKEMYTFDDRNGDSLSLRPEGTAGCVRAAIEHGLIYNQTQRFWYSGPFFRHERPQKGRYRQFHQFGCEVFGMQGPNIDAEMLLMTARFWRDLGLSDHVSLQINSLGTSEVRKQYRELLVTYFSKYIDQLDEESKTRLQINPLRILDSKNPDLQNIILEAPKLLDILDEESRAHFDKICEVLQDAHVKAEINPRLVRGLDYYSHTVFEWVTDALGAQNAICAGGRFNDLVANIGGHATPAVGFAMGLERLINLVVELDVMPKLKAHADIYFVALGYNAEQQSLLLAEQIRKNFNNLIVYAGNDGASFKSQFKKADKSGAKLAIVMGEDEYLAGNLAVKFLREDKPQVEIKAVDLVDYLHKMDL